MSIDSMSGRQRSYNGMPNYGGGEMDDGAFIRKQMERSKAGMQQQYKNSLQSGSKIRQNMPQGRSGDHSRNASSSSLSSQGAPRSGSGMGGRQGGGRMVQPQKSYTDIAGAAGAAGGHGVGYHQHPPNYPPQRQPRKQHKFSGPRFYQAISDIFFSKFLVDELFYYEIRESISRRIQENSHRSDPEDLEDIVREVSEACRSTKLNLDGVVQWKLSRFDHTTESSVIDHVFLINVNIMSYDFRYSRMCIEKYCIDPLCCDLHAESYSENDKARAFRRILNAVLNEAIRTKILTKDQKNTIRIRLVKSHFSIDDRVAVIREMALLIMLGQTERYRELAISGLTTLGTPWAPPAELLSDLDRECSLDPEKVFHKAVAVSTNAYMETILDVSRLGLGLSKNEIESLLSLWAQTVSRAAPSKKLTIPMLLHVLVHSSEAELERAFSMSALKSGAVTTTSDRISQVEDAALQAVQNLGLAWELGDNPPHDLRQLCMTLLLDIGSVFSKFIIREKNANRASAQDLEEIGIVEDGLFTPWFEMCSLMVRHERLKKSYLLSLLISYISISSERLLAQKADFNPEMHLTILLELLTEYRKRRPDYDPICVSLDFNLSDSRDADGRPLELDRATKESIGSEFDRLYAWIDPNISSSNRIRSLLRPLSPKSNQMLTMRRGGTPSAPNNVMNSGDSFNADPNLSDAYINAVALSESFNSNMKFSS